MNQSVVRWKSRQKIIFHLSFPIIYHLRLHILAYTLRLHILWDVVSKRGRSALMRKTDSAHTVSLLKEAPPGGGITRRTRDFWYFDTLIHDTFDQRPTCMENGHLLCLRILLLLLLQNMKIPPSHPLPPPLTPFPRIQPLLVCLLLRFQPPFIFCTPLLPLLLSTSPPCLHPVLACP